MVCLKVGFSSLFFSLYLKKVYERYNPFTVAFSMLYGLCGYVLGYYWNIMWHDCVMILPLVMLGVYSLIRENKWKLYVFSLAMAVISNFYIGFMVCIFTAIYFFCECGKIAMPFKEFLKKLGLIAVCSVLALALTAFISLPAYNALGDTVSSLPNSSSSDEKTLFESLSDDFEKMWKDIKNDGADTVGRLASFNQPVPKEGLPNIFSGFISVMLFGFFLTSKKISLREKVSVTCMIAVLLLSMIISDIDIIWHGMHQPNMVPYRYAFVLSFALITMAYRTLIAEFDAETAKSQKMHVYIVPVIISALVILCAWNKAETATVVGCAALAIVYFVMLTSIQQESTIDMKKKWADALCCLIAVEVIVNTVIAVPTVRTTTYSSYYYRGEEIERLLKDVDADNSYGRVETSQEYILNDPALYGYKGVSTFTSTANYDITKLMEKWALCAPGKSNRYYYQTTSPLINALLGVEHVIFKNDMKNLNPYLEKAAEGWTETNDNGDSYKQVIYKNTEALPIGFMADADFLKAEGNDGGNPFEIQNDMFKKITGIDKDLFVQVPLTSVSAETTVKVTGSKEGEYKLKQDENKEPKMEMNYIAPDDNMLCAYIECKDISKIVVSNTTYKAVKRYYVFPAGKYREGEKFQFRFTFEESAKDNSSMKFYVYSMNEELFEEGMALLRDEPFEIEKYESTMIAGSIKAEEDGVFYTSIPYEKGWKLYVDGAETEIQPYENALVCVPLTKGEHDIVLKYSPYGFTAGVIVSIAALIVAIVLILRERRRSNNG